MARGNPETMDEAVAIAEASATDEEFYVVYDDESDAYLVVAASRFMSDPAYYMAYQTSDIVEMVEPNPAFCAQGSIEISRKGYKRKDGTKVAPVVFCQKDRGRPGARSFGAKSAPPSRRNKKKLIRRPGKLGGPGYTARAERTRHAILNACVKRWGYRSCLGSLQVMLLSTAMGKKAQGVFAKDKTWLLKTYGGPGSFTTRTGKKKVGRKKKKAVKGRKNPGYARRDVEMKASGEWTQVPKKPKTTKKKGVRSLVSAALK